MDCSERVRRDATLASAGRRDGATPLGLIRGDGFSQDSAERRNPGLWGGSPLGL